MDAPFTEPGYALTIFLDESMFYLPMMTTVKRGKMPYLSYLANHLNC